MIFTGFKRKSNQNFFNKRIEELHNDLQVTNASLVRNALIFLDDFSEKGLILNEIREKFGLSENQIQFVIFQKKLDKKKLMPDVITVKDFGWYGNILSSEIKNLLTKEYDLLINYSKVENVFINLLILQCKTTFRVGLSHLDKRLYNLIVNCEIDDYKVFTSEIQKYLRILNKIE